MDIFVQTKILKRTIIILVVLNLLVLGLFALKEFRPSEDNRFNDRTSHGDLLEVLQNELGLSEVQVKEFRNIRSSFMQKENDLETIMRNGRDSMNVEIFRKESDSTLMVSLMQRISKNMFKREMLRFQQAEALKAVCTNEQLLKFELLVIEIRDYLQPEPKKPAPR
jgi:hypothetical protein